MHLRAFLRPFNLYTSEYNFVPLSWLNPDLFLLSALKNDNTQTYQAVECPVHN